MKAFKCIVAFSIAAFIIGCSTIEAPAPALPIDVVHYDNLDYGVPGRHDQLIEREGYALGYSYDMKIPLWVAYRLTSNEVVSTTARRSNNFRVDFNLVTGRSSPEDYAKSGYDKGHLAPAADMHWSTNAMNESFLMSNMAPQTPTLNRRTWSSIESIARRQAIEEGSVFIFTGSIATNMMPKIIGKNRVVVPDAFFKVIYDETPPQKMIGFIVPNESPSTNIWIYACTVSNVEEVTGMKFFTLCTNDVQSLKCAFDPSKWHR